jgi:hypothetical protein
MPERVRRVMRAVVKSPRVMAGRTRCWRSPRPDEGSQLSRTEKTRISMMPSQNVGMAWPSSATTVEK